MISFEVKEKAISLRRRGFSLKEISEKLSISKGTASVWLSRISLSPRAQERLKNKQILGQYKTVLLKRKLKNLQKKTYRQVALKVLKQTHFSKDIAKLCCALLWWCEGNKDDSLVRFTSSDATLVRNFLSLLRTSFEIDEGKFRVLIHLHSYHNDHQQKMFWSKVTGIPLHQFHKSYQKSNTGKRIHKDYQGCIAISYYDAKLAKELEAIYNAFTSLRGAFVNG